MGALQEQLRRAIRDSRLVERREGIHADECFRLGRKSRAGLMG